MIDDGVRFIVHRRVVERRTFDGAPPRDEIGEPLGAELRVKVTAPPVDAAANEAVIRLLAETCDCPRSQIQILRGQTSRHKMVKIYGAKAADVLAKLRAQ